MKRLHFVTLIWICGLFLPILQADLKAAKMKPKKPLALNQAADSRLKPGVDAMQAGNYFQACNILMGVVNAAPTNLHARATYAKALFGAGRYEQAREQMSVVISQDPNMVEAYTIRARSAAHMGNRMRAEKDLELARKIDRRDSFKIIGKAEKEVKKTLSSLPGKSASKLHDELLKAALKGERLSQLTERALALRKASNAERLRGDEVYSDKRREWGWRYNVNPKDADLLVDYGMMIVDELNPRGEYVENGNFVTDYRIQGKALENEEISLAQYLFNIALSLKREHPGALLGLARIEFRANMWANAERYLRRALASGKPDPKVLYMMRDILQIAAGQQMARSMALRQVRTWEEKIGDKIYIYKEYPSEEELRRADIADRKADNFFYSSDRYWNKVIKGNSKDPRTHDFIGGMAYRAENYKIAVERYAYAVKLEPDKLEYRYALSNAYARANQVDKYIEQANIGRNLEHTTASAELHWARNTIHKQDWKYTQRLIDRAIETDPADARAIAYMAIMAEARGKKRDAIAYYLAALALEEARAKLRGCSWLNGTGYWYVNDISRAIELRTRVATLLEDYGTETAKALYLANVKLESNISDAALKEQCFTAMMPIAGLPKNMREEPPRFGELMRTNRALAAYQLYKEGNYQEAAKHFSLLADYEKRRRSAGGKAYDALRDKVWLSQPMYQAAQDCFRKTGNQRLVNVWRQEHHKVNVYGPDAFRNVSGDWRRHEPTSGQFPRGARG